ncbi:hypothetical protein NYR55_12765 [Sphingomonas sp. BGYR3]|uniref:hypothetical protein n=1 Tax=Sphingomonas sp. BGYR3 TaxID=2975483 RepID=UPI0021A803CE|nr:hypothetical protein [Sphingomonas sp. BGYR3]MDG5489489.1 hypothetical protein [Sphingomonas sp. BGYR3]
MVIESIPIGRKLETLVLRQRSNGFLLQPMTHLRKNIGVSIVLQPISIRVQGSFRE